MDRPHENPGGRELRDDVIPWRRDAALSGFEEASCGLEHLRLAEIVFAHFRRALRADLVGEVMIDVVSFSAIS
jgi:hypothetical protein